MSRYNKQANYEIIRETAEYVLIDDLGPWDEFPTVTNDAENVIKQMLPLLDGRQLHYIDSEGEVAELCIKDGRFSGFRFIATHKPHWEDWGDDGV